jgi:hypothetical protein
MSDVVAELIDDWLEKHPIDVPNPPLPKQRQQTTTKNPTPAVATTKAKRSKGTQQQNGGSDD